MSRNIINAGLIVLMIVGVTACAPSPLASTHTAQPASSTAFVSLTSPNEATETSAPAPAVTKKNIPVTGHLMKPADIAPAPGKLISDVKSSGTAAPYGDSYKINRFERPFLKDMTYVSDMDIVTFNLSEDADWYYISIELNGNDPNNSVGINYGVEIDLDVDGFGDYIIWAHPPYTTSWDTTSVQVFKDSDHDSGGLSSRQSDMVFDGNGYDKLVFDGETSENADPDLAWVRMNEGPKATIQFAFKKSWIGSTFIMAVVSDAGLKDVSKFDYNDRFKEADAGSPVRNNKNYPLGSLYAIDNTCWQAYDIQTIAYEPKFCPTYVTPTSTHKSPANVPPTSTVPPPTNTLPPPIDTVPPPANTLPPPIDTVPPPANTLPPPIDTVPPPANTLPPPIDTVPPESCDPPPPCADYDPITCECL